MKNDSRCNMEFLKSLSLIDKLPDVFGRNDNVPPGLLGATVLRIGTPTDSSLLEGGGLVIDYRPPSSPLVRRAVLAMNDCAMWVVADFAVAQESQEPCVATQGKAPRLDGEKHRKATRSRR